MIFHEYDPQGWLIGWYDAATSRPNSTAIDPQPIPPSRARWNGTAWTNDPAQELARAAKEDADRTKRQQAIAVLKAYDPAIATATDVRTTLGATILLLRDIIQELRG